MEGGSENLPINVTSLSNGPKFKLFVLVDMNNAPGYGLLHQEAVDGHRSPVYENVAGREVNVAGRDGNVAGTSNATEPAKTADPPKNSPKKPATESVKTKVSLLYKYTVGI